MEQTVLSPPCALCGAKRKLELSHIIPQFVYRWRNEMSESRDRRPVPATDRGSQNVVARPMLCGHCEDLFSSHESEFARLVFHPFADRSTLTAKYGGWLRKFAVSVCWRILEEYTLENRLGHFQGRWTADLVSCRETWKRYLSGKLPDVGRHHVHLLPWNGVTGAEGVELSASLNPHLRRTIEMDVPCSDRDSFVYAKLGPLLLFGLIADPDPKQWRGTRINAEGKLKSRDIAVPGEFSNYVAARTRLQHPSIGMV